MTVHDDFLAELSAFRSGPAPEAGPELRALFASVADPSSACEAAVSVAGPARRIPVYKRILAGLPSKVAAGLVGAVLAGTLGAGAGTLTGTMMLTSDDAPVVEETVEPAEEQEQEQESVVDEAVVEEQLEASDPSADGAPTSVSEAAHNHESDEACGNHGMYVSSFAQSGEEPECATAAGTEGGDVEQEKDEVKVARTEAREARQTAKAAGNESGKGSR